MLVSRRFKQVDVFSAVPYRGNPLAVVVDGDGLSTEEMQQFANWTNLSETTFLLPPTDPAADYRVRIFTPFVEFPFAGHPTLGSCHAWLEAGNTPHDDEFVVQECGVGLVRLRRAHGTLAFAAPPMIRSGPVEPDVLTRVAAALGIEAGEIVAARWIDNGPGWIGVLLADADAVLAIEPGSLDGLHIGVAGPHPEGSPQAFEVRGFFPKGTATAEDPVTGSLNASLAQWFIAEGLATAPYSCRQGTALGRAGVVTIERPDPTGDIWIGGRVVTCVDGTVLV